MWDDDAHVTNNATLTSLDGLRRIWVEPSALPQYYPLVHTSFWVEARLWGMAPFGYHLDNVLLHILNSLLLWTFLRRMCVPGAWLAASVFALHPVHVESVAWITERKNLLSAFFYLLAAMGFLHFFGVRGREDSNGGDESEGERKHASHEADAALHSAVGLPAEEARVVGRHDGDHVPSAPNEPIGTAGSLAFGAGGTGDEWHWYAAGFLLFLLALLSKTVTASLPLALLILLWWKKKRVGLRDLAALAPLVVLGAALGFVTVWLETHHVGAQGRDWTLSFLDRALIAGRAPWFYLGKILWPAKLTFFYPRWTLDPTVWWQDGFPLLTAATVVILWMLRRRLGRGPLAAFLFFLVTLGPALGFFDVFPMRYAFVADHFQYLASVGPIAFFAAMVALGAGRGREHALGSGLAERRFGTLFPKTLFPRTERPGDKVDLAESPNLSSPLGGATVAGSAKRTRIPNPPAGLMSRTRGGKGRGAEAVHSGPPGPSVGLRLTALVLVVLLGALTWSRAGAFRDAETLWRDTVLKNPGAWAAHNNLGLILARRGDIDGAVARYTEALRLHPNFVEAHCNLGNALLKLGRRDEAIAHYSTAVSLEPGYTVARYNLASALLAKGDERGAIEHLTEVVRLEPALGPAHEKLALALQRSGRLGEASEHEAEALRLRAWFLSTHETAAVRNGPLAVQLAERARDVGKEGPRSLRAAILDTLAASYAETGRFDDAVRTARSALDLAREAGEVDLSAGISTHLQSYEAGRPIRDPSMSRLTVASRK